MTSTRAQLIGTAKTVSKNTLLLLAGSAVSQIFRLVYVSLLARYVGATGFGQISTAIGFVSLLFLIVNFGLDTLLVRDVAADKTRAANYISNVAGIRLVLTGVLIAVLAVALSQSPYAAQTRIIIVIYAVVYGFDAFSLTAFSVFDAFQKMEYRTALEVGRDLINVAISILGILLGWSLEAIVAVSAFASLLKLIASVIVLQKRFTAPAIRFDLAFSRSLLVTALPFFTLVIVTTAFDRLSLVILSWLDTAETVGLYSAAWTLVSTLLLVPAMFYQSIFPVFSEYHETADSTLRRAYTTFFRAMLLVGFPMGAGIILVSDEVISLVYGPGFEGASLVMDILAVQFFTMVGYVNGAFMNATGRQTFFAIAQAILVVLNLILTFMLVPVYRHVGAALAVTLPSVVSFVLYSVLCHRYLELPLPWLAFLKVTLGTAIMVGAGHVALNNGVNVFIVMLLAPLLYVISLVAVRVVSPEEWFIIREVFLIQRLQRILTG